MSYDIFVSPHTPHVSRDDLLRINQRTHSVICSRLLLGFRSSYDYSSLSIPIHLNTYTRIPHLLGALHGSSSR